MTLEESMKKIDDGGPAFPAFGDGPNVPYQEPGMTLRDWFAGQALTGILASNVPQRLELHGLVDHAHTISAAAAYTYADAMIRARAPSQDGGK